MPTRIRTDTLPRSFDDECEREDTCMVHSIRTCVHARTHVRVPGVTRMHTAPAAHGKEGDYEATMRGRRCSHRTRTRTCSRASPSLRVLECVRVPAQLGACGSRTTKSKPASALSQGGDKGEGEHGDEGEG
ncbi:hypothetical protein B0H13DRAFT_2375786 [Mycena leptocephala]|nr:hypothetical protein B0H13DRAFT_2375786 [Mycena leptocephala]